MDVRLGLLVLLVLGFMDAFHAREMPQNLQAFDYHKLASKVYSKDFRNDKLCVFCEEYAEMALDYLTDNKTQAEIIKILHASCSELASFRKQCVTLVDYYVPMFFLEISSIEPEMFCEKVGLCREVLPNILKIKENSCELCKDTVSDVVGKLKNPDTQMDIIHMLLKACDSTENYETKCKKMVFEYAPLLIANTAQFLETHDICITVHVCNAPAFTLGKRLADTDISSFSDS